MSNATRRRNGALASCEPCRKGKTRCDHRKPRCGTCHRRGLDDECWYHSAPLTKPRSRRNPGSSGQSPVQNLQMENHPNHPGPRDTIGRGDSSLVLPAQTWPVIPDTMSTTTSQSALYFPYGQSCFDERLSITKDLVSSLKYIEKIESDFGDIQTWSPQLVFKLISVLRNCPEFATLLGDLKGQNQQGVYQYAKGVLQRSSAPIELDSTSTLEDFCLQYSGPNLRVETMGLLYAIGALITMHNPTQDRMKQDPFMQEMIQGSYFSLRLARDLADQSNDILVWLAYVHFQVAGIVEGDASLSLRRRLADLCTEVLALNLHRESTYTDSKLPLYVNEHRRRVFVSSYALDKANATVFGRPPCIPMEYVDCMQPLDIPDEVLFGGDQTAVEEAKKYLTPEGWDSRGDHHIGTWARFRYLIGHFRARVNQYQFRNIQEKELVELRDLSTYCHKTWDALPPHLKYSKECWKSLSPDVCFMLGKLYMAYLFVDLLIHQMIGAKQSTVDPCLVQISIQALETVVQMVNARDRVGFSPRDLSSLLLSHGFSAAVVLTTVLQEASNDPSKRLDSSIKRSLVLRNLAVLVSHLETVSDVSERNSAFCLQAARAISEKLDRLLDGSENNSGRPIPALGSSESTRTALGSMDDNPATPSGFLNLDNLDINNFDFGTWYGAGDFGSYINQWDMH